MTVLEWWLVLAALLVWLPTVGYFVALELALRLRGDRRPPPDPASWPPVAVVLPVRDEETWIDDRLRDFARLDYPPDRLELWVVDGGSRDRTVARIEAAATDDPRMQLLRIEDSRSKMEQIRLALEKLRTPVAVVTDADVALAPETIRALVRVLEDDPGTALVGAHIEPDTPLLEERLHWWLLDRLWWLEGEVLGAAGVAAPCYALRPDLLREALPADVTADDVHLALIAGSRGWRVRRAPTARVRELRVPRTAAELLRYRRRRGGGFVQEVRTFLWRDGLGLRFRAALALRYWQLRIVPRLALGLLVAAPTLAGVRGVFGLAVLAAAVGLPLVVASRTSDAFADSRRPAWRLPLAGLRLLAANALALLVPGHDGSRPRGGP